MSVFKATRQSLLLIYSLNSVLSCHFRVYLTDNRVPNIFFDIRLLVMWPNRKELLSSRIAMTIDSDLVQTWLWEIKLSNWICLVDFSVKNKYLCQYSTSGLNLLNYRWSHWQIFLGPNSLTLWSVSWYKCSWNSLWKACHWQFETSLKLQYLYMLKY